MYISAGKEGPEIRRSWLTRQVTKEAGEFTHLMEVGSEHPAANQFHREDAEGKA